MSENLLVVETREVTGKKFAKKLRRQGKVPGIFYAHDEKSISITLDEREITKLLMSETGLIDIQIGKKRKRKAIIKEVQTDPVKQSLVHVDVMGVRLKEKIHVEVPIQILGEAVGVKEQGGILHQYLREVEVSCLPLDIPDHIEIDVSDLKIGDTITLDSLLVENVEILGEPGQPIINILPPTVAREKVEEEVKEVEKVEKEVAEKESTEKSEKES